MKPIQIDFDIDDVIIMCNAMSGNVFLTNSDAQVAMLSGGKLESFYSCFNCGSEGFWEEFKRHSTKKDCKACIKDIKENRK